MASTKVRFSKVSFFLFFEKNIFKIGFSNRVEIVSRVSGSGLNRLSVVYNPYKLATQKGQP